MRIALFFVAQVFFASDFFGQNLILNPSFEAKKIELLNCTFDGRGGRLTQAIKNWNGFFEQTPDPHFHDGTVLNCPVPKPRTGKMAVGLILFHPRIDDFYHEFLQGSLAKPLEKGKTYRFEFWMTQADSAGVFHIKKQLRPNEFSVPVAASRLGFLFSVEPNSPNENFQRSISEFDLRPQFVFEEILATAAGEWKKFGFDFTADKPYKFFTLGNFSSDAVTRTEPPTDGEIIKLRSFGEGQKIDRAIAYALFDDFSMAEKKADAPVESFENLKKGQVFVFKNVLFDFGKAELLAPSFTELEKLAAFLAQNPSVRLEIAGHTDDVGDDRDNLLLSENRARSVVAFLAKKGVDEKRLAARGFGESQPVAPNDSDANRSLNRRVECRPF